jgi:hypothetical protein
VQHAYKADYDKIKTLEVQLTPGKILFIPAYWWYSIKYYDEATICTFKYRTYMNTVAILPQLFLYFLQRQNVKRTTVKRMEPTESSTGGGSGGGSGGDSNNHTHIASVAENKTNSDSVNTEIAVINALPDTLISNIEAPLTHQIDMQTVD